MKHFFLSSGEMFRMDGSMFELRLRNHFRHVALWKVLFKGASCSAEVRRGGNAG